MGFEPGNLIRTRSADHIRASGHAPRKQAGHMTCTRPQAARQIPLATRASSTHVQFTHIVVSGSLDVAVKELLTRMGHPPQDKVTLVVQSLTTSKTQTRKNVPMTEANRQAIRAAAETRSNP